MRHLKKGLKIFFKILLLLLIVPIVMHAGFLFIQSVMRTCSIYSSNEIFEWPANDFMAKYGNRYFAFDLIYYFSREREPFYHEAANHDVTLAKLFKKYPEMREEYLGALVEAILDGKTSNYNRIMLIYNLEQITGIKFTEQGDKRAEYEKLKPYTQKGIRNIADWWSKHLEDNATAAIAATEKDYLFPPLPHESLK
jgi:hypothetical protein